MFLNAETGIDEYCEHNLNVEKKIFNSIVLLMLRRNSVRGDTDRGVVEFLCEI